MKIRDMLTCRRWITAACLLLGGAWLGIGPWPKAWVENSLFLNDPVAANREIWSQWSLTEPVPTTPGELSAGVGVVDITDRVEKRFQTVDTRHLSLGGHGKRALTQGNQGIESHLFTKAIAVSNGTDPIVFVTADLLLINDRLATGLFTELGRRAQPLRREQVFFSATHTHSGYGGFAGRCLEVPSLGFYRPEVTEVLIQSLADAVEQSLRTMQPASVSFSSLDLSDENWVVHRLHPSRPTYDWLDLMDFRQKHTGERLATMVTFAAHATCHPRADRRVSGDYPGVLCASVERETNAPCLFLAGPVGSMGPVDLGSPRTIWADRLGSMLAHRVLELLDTMPPYESSLPLVSHRVEVALPSPVLRCGREWRWSPILAKAVVPSRSALHAVRLGSRAFVSTPSDFSGELALELRSQVPSLTTLVTSFGGDYVGYILPTDAVDLPTYESRHANLLAPSAGEWFSMAIENLVQRLAKPSQYNTKPSIPRIYTN